MRDRDAGEVASERWDSGDAHKRKIGLGEWDIYAVGAAMHRYCNIGQKPYTVVD